MKIIRHGDVEKQKFIGTQHECVKCFTVFEVQTTDDVMRVLSNGIGCKDWAQVRCPGCQKEITITVGVRFIGDNETAKPL